MKTQLLYAIAIVATMVVSSTTRADVIASYDFEAVQSWETVYQNTFGLSVSRDVAPDSAASFYQTRNGNFSSNDSGITPNVANYQNHAFAFSTNTKDDTDPSGMGFYHEFAVTIQNDNWELDELCFDYWVNNTPNVGDFSVSVYSDQTGYGMGSELLKYNYVKQTPSDVEVQKVTLGNLSSIGAFQNLASGDQVEFRMVFNDDFPGGFVHRVNDVTLTANRLSSVPEPASVGLLMTAGMGLILRRRRRNA